jgi:formate hydrogenlyase subunit 6/NADH:ubiquinone oxidoreductase subunit I
MLNILLTRARQGHRTIGYPAREPILPDRMRGRPALDASRCVPGCRACAEVCPTAAITVAGGRLLLDLGRCLFCPECSEACAAGAIEFTREHRLATRRREDLVVGKGELRLAESLDREGRRLFGRSLR